LRESLLHKIEQPIPFPRRIFSASFRGAGEACEPGIHTHHPWLWIPALAAIAARPE